MGTALETAIGSSTTEIMSVLTTNLPAIFVVFGSLVALGLGIKLFKKLVGRKAV